MDKKINFRVTKEESLILADEAKRQGITVSALCRRQILLGSGITSAIESNELKEMIRDVDAKLNAIGTLQAETLQVAKESANKSEDLIRKMAAYIDAKFESFSTFLNNFNKQSNK